MLINDHQHWHLGHTITWTPLMNIEIVKILLQCTLEDLLPQFLDAEISKILIARYDTSLLQAISQYKNYNSGENLKYLV